MASEDGGGVTKTERYLLLAKVCVCVVCVVCLSACGRCLALSHKGWPHFTECLS